MTAADAIRSQLRAIASPQRARSSAGYFQAGPGGYGEGDVFLGVPVPEQRVIARAHRHLPVTAVVDLLHSPEHECRLTALLVWTYQFPHASVAERAEIVDAYLANTAWIDNWDLVDVSAGLLGRWLADRPRRERALLDRLAGSASLWERRIAVLATFPLIKGGDAADALRLAELLAHDPEALVQKAVGWMLREVGRSCGEEVEHAWLLEHRAQLARTTLRYAVERFPEEQRQAYLAGQYPSAHE